MADVPTTPGRSELRVGLDVEGRGSANDANAAAPFPAVPAVRRTFGKTDVAEVFMRVYQRSGRPVAAAVKTEIRDSTDAVVGTDGSTFAASEMSDYRYRLPLAELGARQYLVTITVAAGERVAQRDLRFRVD